MPKHLERPVKHNQRQVKHELIARIAMTKALSNWYDSLQRADLETPLADKVGQKLAIARLREVELQRKVKK
jgi:hypothetical protein